MIKKPTGILFDFFNTIVRRVDFDPAAGIAATLRLAKNASTISAESVLARSTALEAQLSGLWSGSEVWTTFPQFHRLLFDGLGLRSSMRGG